MERPCYKCGQTVEEGVAFCPHCGAPQIRVVVAEPAPEAASAAEAMANVHDSPLPASKTVPVLAVPMQWSRATKPCALAALLASLLTLLGLNAMVAMLGVGFLAVVLYRQRTPGAQISTFNGAALGALGGVLWFAISSIAVAGVVIFLHKGPTFRDEMLQRLQQAGAGTNDPQVLSMLNYFKTPEGLIALLVFSLVFALLLSIVLGSAGGALGAVLFGRRNKS
jgi:hypothetical protein